MTKQEASDNEVVQETESTEEVSDDNSDSEESRKKGASNRIRELNARAKEAEARAESLAERLQTLTGNPEAGNDPVIPTADEPIIKSGEEIDGLELDKRLRDREAKIMQRTDARIMLINKQNQTINRINSEATKALATYPELDPDNKESFNRDLSESVTEAVEAYVKADPYNASVEKFVAKLMKPYKAAVAREVGQATENIAKQVSETALRPSSIRKAEKSASEKSIAELEDELGIVQA